jgi:hypothetical protein
MDLKHFLAVSMAFGFVGVAFGTETNQAFGSDWSALTAATDYSYVGASHAKFPGAERSDADAQTAGGALLGRIPVRDGWFVPVNVNYQHISIEQVKGAPVPQNLDLLRIGTGLGCRFTSNLTVSASAGPLFYNLEEVRTSSLGFGGAIMASYVLNPRLRLATGIAINPDSRFPVFPMTGVNWKIRDDLTLDVGAPKTRLVYRFAPKATVYTGAGFQYGTFRTGDTLAGATGVPGFNNAIGTYEDVRVGAGLGYEIDKQLSAEIEGGYSVFRRIDYTRLHEHVNFTPGPYVQCGLRFRF